MPESQKHIATVKRVLAYIEQEYASVKTLYAATDLPGHASPNRPPNIGGFVPDIFCSNTPVTLTVIGEAKTSEDLQRPRSLAQITAFYEHLEHSTAGHLAIGVPWQDEAFVYNFLKRLKARSPNKPVRTSIVTEMRVLQCF